MQEERIYRSPRPGLEGEVDHARQLSLARIFDLAQKLGYYPSFEKPLIYQTADYSCKITKYSMSPSSDNLPLIDSVLIKMAGELPPEAPSILSQMMSSNPVIEVYIEKVKDKPKWRRATRPGKGRYVSSVYYEGGIRPGEGLRIPLESGILENTEGVLKFLEEILFEMEQTPNTY